MNGEKYEVVKFIDDELELEVSVDPNEETIWMSLDQISLLFDRDKSVISRHIKNIFCDKELKESAVVAKNATTASDGKTYQVTFYNLDMIISVGYRVNSKRGTVFRKWANKVLKEYLLKGYVINENRTIVTNDNFNNLLLIVNDIKTNQLNVNERLEKIENKVFNKEYGLDKIFYNGQFYDAYTLIQSIFESAKNEIIIIDSYVDRTILDRLVVKKDSVKVIIYTSITTSKLLGKDINANHSNLDVSLSDVEFIKNTLYKSKQNEQYKKNIKSFRNRYKQK